MAYFDCELTGCLLEGGHRLRARMGCRLPGLGSPTASFDKTAHGDLRASQGLTVINNGAITATTEDPEDGCPGSWVRSRFARSFSRYQRARAEGGMRVQNPLITPDTDELILEALRYFEREHEGGEGRYRREWREQSSA